MTRLQFSLFPSFLILGCFLAQSALAIAPVPQVEVESNDTAETATPISLDFESKGIIVGALSVGDNDYFSFEAPAGSRLGFSLMLEEIRTQGQRAVTPRSPS